MLEKLKKLWEGNSGNKKLRPFHYLIVILGVGVAAMILTDFLAVEKDQAPLGFVSPRMNLGARQAATHRLPY